MRIGFSIALAAVALAGRTTQAQAPAQSPPLSLAVTAAITQLSAEDYAQREKAVEQLQAALGQEMRTLLEVRDPEAQARIGDVLTFEQGLCSWAKDVLRLPRDKQKEALDLGLKPEVLPYVALLYAKETSKRVDAVKALRKLPGAGVTDLLAKALDDPEQRVYVAAMEGVWDRPATDAVVESLWNRAVTDQFATMKPQPVNRLPDAITFRGRPIQVLDNGDNSLYLRTQGNQLAADVLAHINAPQVGKKLQSLFEEAEAVFSRRNPNGAGDQDVWMYMPTQESMKNATRLAETYKPKESVPVLYRIATGPVLQKSSGQLNRQSFYWSNRTWALALTLKITGQSTDDCNLQVMNSLSGMWTQASEADEKAALTKLREWWAKDHEKWGGAVDNRPEQPDNQPVNDVGPIIVPLKDPHPR
jgi:hypothetical protein